jgi:hypothetical protein
MDQSGEQLWIYKLLTSTPNHRAEEVVPNNHSFSITQRCRLQHKKLQVNLVGTTLNLPTLM